jgi:tetratricopeptide (TPR) repeat protein
MGTKQRCRRQTAELLASLAVAASALALLVAPVARAQSPPETKQDFVAGLMEFAAAATGTFGDEGIQLLSAISSMENGLIKWDAQVWVYETLIASKVGSADQQVAADMRTVLGALFLERGRLDETLREFERAAQLDPQRVDIRMFQALAYATAEHHLDAARTLDAASQLDPADPIKPYQMALQLAKAGRSQEASDALGRVLRITEGHEWREATGTARRTPFVEATLVENVASGVIVFVPARYAEGFALIRQRKYEQALDRLRAASAVDPLNADPAASSPRMAQGIAALRQGQFKAAIDHLRAGVELMPDSAEAHRILGTAFWADQAFDASIRELEDAVRLNPGDERSRITLADVLIEAGQAPKALDTLRNASAAIPQSGLVRYRLGRLYQSLQRDAEALHEFDDALRLGPVTGVSSLLATIGYLHLNTMNFDGAIEAYRQRIEADPNSAQAHRQLGDAYRKQGRHDEAFAEFVVALTIDPESADAHAALGQLYVASGRPEKAVIALQRAVALNPAHNEARYALGTTLVRLGRVEEGQKELQVFQQLQADAIKKERESYEVNLIRLEATLRGQEGKHAEAAALWQKVVDQEPNQASNYLGLAQALGRAERYDAAVEAYLQVLKREDRADVHRQLSELYSKLGRTAEAESERARYEQLSEQRFREPGDNR